MIKVTFLHNTNKPQNKSNGLLENRMRDLCEIYKLFLNQLIIFLIDMYWSFTNIDN